MGRGNAEGTEFKRRSKHYTDSAKAGRRDALLKIVGSDRNVVVAVEQLDAKPLLLACRNGTVDLATENYERQIRISFDK